MLRYKLLTFALAILCSCAFVHAGTYTADFSGVTDLNSNTNGEGRTFSLLVGDVTLTVSAWSDTANNPNDDPIIRHADLDKFGAQGWGIDNQDEQCNQSSSGTCASEHSADNFSRFWGPWHDYDTFLIEFSEEVKLTEAGFGWLFDENNTEISSAAISSDLAANLDGSTWAEVMADAGLLWSDSSSVDAVTYDASIDAGQTVSQYWLLGAYNSVFSSSFDDSLASNYNDGVKLTTIGFDTVVPTKKDIPEPSTIFLYLLPLLLFVRRASSPYSQLPPV